MLKKDYNIRHMRDFYFREPLQKVVPFSFDESVASVFDDMIERSVPFYRLNTEILIDILRYFVYPRIKIYDLGCSTGTTLDAIRRHFHTFNPELVGIDNSEPMVEKARQKALQSSTHSKQEQKTSIEFMAESILETELTSADFYILNYTLQFISPEHREDLIEKIYQQTNPGGALYLSEKIVHSNEEIESLATDIYYDYKSKRGYNDLEISQKRNALENVLVPDSIKDHVSRLTQIGYSKVEVVFKWFNFCTILAIK